MMFCHFEHLDNGLQVLFVEACARHHVNDQLRAACCVQGGHACTAESSAWIVGRDNTGLTVGKLLAVDPQPIVDCSIHRLDFLEIFLAIAKPLSSPSPLCTLRPCSASARSRLSILRTSRTVSVTLACLIIALVIFIVLVVPSKFIVVFLIVVDAKPAPASRPLLLVLLLGNCATRELLLELRVVNEVIIILVIVCGKTVSSRAGWT